MSEMQAGAKDTVEKMRQMAQKGYDSKHIGQTMIIPQMGKKVRAHQNKLSLQDKAKIKMRTAFQKKTGKPKAEAKGKNEEQAELETPRTVAEPEAEPKELGPPDNLS